MITHPEFPSQDLSVVDQQALQRTMADLRKIADWAVVQAADGQIVLVDLSALSSGASSLKAGSSIAVYGTPGDQKFQAMGLIQPDNRPPAKPVTVPPRR